MYLTVRYLMTLSLLISICHMLVFLYFIVSAIKTLPSCILLSHIFLKPSKFIKKTSFHFSTMASRMLLIGLFFVASCSLALASDPSPLQDFCVADPNSRVRVNGVVCKDPNLVQANDFLFRGLNVMGDTSNEVESNVTAVNVEQLPGLNTLGISMARIDFAPQGINPPHTHPRATEILVVINGSLEVGFVTSNPDNRLLTKVLEMGDVFVFPQGLIHFQRNVGHGYAVAIAGLSSQNPGLITIANAVFGSKPDINGDILAKAFQVDKNVVYQIQSKF